MGDLREGNAKGPDDAGSVPTGDAAPGPAAPSEAIGRGPGPSEAVGDPSPDADGPPPEAKEAADLPVTMRDLFGVATLMAVFAGTMVMALLMAKPFVAAGLQAFEDPENVGNSLVYILLLIAFTVVILWIAKRGKKWMIRAIILTAVAGTVLYAVPPLLVLTGLPWSVAFPLGVAVAAGSAAALYFHPEWYVIDAVGIVVAAAAASLFGISLGLIPVLVLLVALAVYDAIAVYKTKHMLTLADSVMELRLPVLLVIPKTLHYSFLDEVSRFRKAGTDEGEPPEDRDALFMGLGDLVMPTILVVSAWVFGGAEWGPEGAFGAALGTLLGFVVLMMFVLRGRPQAGLPLLNGGAIAGFFVGLFAATGSLVFW